MPKRCVAYGCGSTNRDSTSLQKMIVLCKLWTQVQRTRDKWSGPTAYSFCAAIISLLIVLNQILN